MSRAVERLGGIVIPPRSVPTAQPRLISAFTDIGQGAGLSTTTGMRPLLPPIVVGVMAHENAGVNFSGTDWSWMESWVWIGILAVLFVGAWLIDRAGKGRLVRLGGREPEAPPGYPLLCAVMGGLLFAGTLADGGHKSWPGLVAGALLGIVGYLAFALFFARANRRLAAAGDPGVVLGLGRDALTIAVTVLVVLVDVAGYVVLVVALILLATARRREGEKYEGLRVLR
jgi:Domain of unknown function (DUF4126)